MCTRRFDFSMGSLKHVSKYCVFYSTMLTSEGIDEMARFAGKYEEVKALTIKAMGGNMSFRQCLTERLSIIQPTTSMVIIVFFFMLISCY